MDDANTLTSETASPGTNPSTPAESEPAFLARARRILADDIRPEDYLTVTPEVQRRVALCLQYANARGNGQPLAPEVEPLQLRQELLSFHHGGQNIAYIEDDNGVIVLAVGLEHMRSVLETFLGRISRTITVDTPFPLDNASEYASTWISHSTQTNDP
ncbi:MAG TPA: hypothetical protein VG122_12370 [Gemmata sp.]|jgi:hypothetical protein|nr:hypothetical protein [Gemmata sp.]